MLSFVQVARIEARFGQWQALITLADDGVPESHFVEFSSQPSALTATTAGGVLASTLNADRAAAELSAMIEGGPLTRKYQTLAQLAQRFRAAYQSAAALQAAKMAYWMIERINDGTFTDAQVQNVFNLTAAQYTAAKARFTALHDQWTAVLSAAGE